MHLFALPFLEMVAILKLSQQINMTQSFMQLEMGVLKNILPEILGKFSQLFEN